jgi:hypothetical protein
MTTSSSIPSTPAAQAPFSAERWRQFWDNWKAQSSFLAFFVVSL